MRFTRHSPGSYRRARADGAASGPGASALLAVVLLVAMAGAAEAEPKVELDPSYKSSLGHKVVLITAKEINPEETELVQGQLVAWISYAPQPVTVVFDREVARNMICHSLVNFALRDGELKSEPIKPGEFASFCELQPGKYEYRVVQEPKSPDENKPSALEGQLVVGAPE